MTAHNQFSSDTPRNSLAEQIYVALKADMHDFRLIPGDRLSEAEVGQRLGASRTPVREALFRLRKEGFLEVEAKTGWFVKPLDFIKLEELYDLCSILEVASIGRLHARGIDVLPELESLQTIWFIEPAAFLTDAYEMSATDEAFHASLVRLADNTAVAQVHAEVTDRIRIIRRLDLTRPERIAATYDAHSKILRAIAAGKADIAQYMLRSHIEQCKSEIRKITLQTLFDARERARARITT